MEMGTYYWRWSGDWPSSTFWCQCWILHQDVCSLLYWNFQLAICLSQQGMEIFFLTPCRVELLLVLRLLSRILLLSACMNVERFASCWTAVQLARQPATAHGVELQRLVCNPPPFLPTVVSATYISMDDKTFVIL